jgi:hypothetical protein
VDTFFHIHQHTLIPPLFRDPTHVNYITEETFSIYFDEINNYAKIYGFNGGFEITEQGWNGFTLLTLMRKPAIRA